MKTTHRKKRRFYPMTANGVDAHSEGNSMATKWFRDKM